MEITSDIGDKIAFKCNLNDSEEIQWFKDGKPLNTKSPRIKFGNLWLRIEGIKFKDEGDYGCKTIDGKWRNFTLITKNIGKSNNQEFDEDDMLHHDDDLQDDEDIKPYFVNFGIMHDNIAVLNNHNVTISCPNYGSPTPENSWLKNGLNILVNNSSMSFDNVSKEDNGNYTCIVRNQHGAINHTTNLKVFDKMENLPIIIKTPTNTTIAAGESTVFQCAVKAINITNITWLKHGYIHPSAINSSELIAKYKINLNQSDLEVLELHDVHSEDEGWYTCIAETPKGSSRSSAWLQIEDDREQGNNREKPMAPSFFKPDKMHKVVAKPAGNMLRLKCLSIGNPIPNITWFKNGAVPKRNLGSVKYNKWSLMLEDLVTSDSGNYTCRVCNEFGCIEYTFKVFVQERMHHRPILTQAPKNQTLLIGTSGEFWCKVLSDLHPHVRWFKGFINSNTTNYDNLVKAGNDDKDPEKLELHNVTHEDEGWYTCIAGNSLGLTYSSAYLHVIDEAEQVPFSETTNINLIAAGVFAFFIILAAIFMFTVSRKLKREKLKKLLAIEAERAAAITQWTKKVIIEKQCLVNEQDPLLLPVVKIEKQRTRCGKVDALPSEYELPLDSDWEFPRSELILSETLGEGAFGKVVKAEATGIVQQGLTTVVAVKMLKEGHTDAEMMDLVSEMEMMKLIGKHRNIINILGTCTQDGPLYVIVEYAPHGNLRDFLRAHRPSSGYEPAIGESLADRTALTEKDLVSFAYQVARGMDYLSSRRCIHRDLAARNVLVSDNYVLKIADFGLARDIHSHDYYRKTTDGRLPVKWMAPEALFHRVYTTQSDVWSYGVLLWEIMTLGGTPYPSVPSMEKLFQLLRSGHRMEKPPCCSLEIYMLMRDCWCYQPNERPLFSELVEGLDRILTLAANKEYLDLDLPQLNTPPTSDDSSEENFPYLL
ncbi:hypothetical protein O3M35_012851 [Rhynocoris fuscipes]